MDEEIAVIRLRWWLGMRAEHRYRAIIVVLCFAYLGMLLCGKYKKDILETALLVSEGITTTATIQSGDVKYGDYGASVFADITYDGHIKKNLPIHGDPRGGKTLRVIYAPSNPEIVRIGDETSTWWELVTYNWGGGGMFCLGIVATAAFIGLAFASLLIVIMPVPQEYLDVPCAPQDFSAQLRRVPKQQCGMGSAATPEDGAVEIAKWHMPILQCALCNAVLMVPGMWPLYVTFIPIEVLCVYRMARAVGMIPAMLWLCMLGMCVPVLNLLLLFILSQWSSRALRDGGFKVGLMGLNVREIDLQLKAAIQSRRFSMTESNGATERGRSRYRN